MSRLTDYFSNRPYIMLPTRISNEYIQRTVDPAIIVDAFNSQWINIPIDWATCKAVDTSYNLFMPALIDSKKKDIPPVMFGDCDDELNWMTAWFKYIFGQNFPIIAIIGYRKNASGKTVSHAFYATLDCHMAFKYHNVTQDALKQYFKFVDVQIR